ncbi:hypothetical protein QBC32DRAFT_96224 [Pseudoneurospora amorphoporcata]|uniref:Autophagy-related protein 28 n=1 Tax=Pseudoneurospora amorphoporcata TaxID=241081 RepID=A0AAN6NLT5_9PEZI|nr:hypothetical protein QBC32DRAFT_96224 [Pseudoneurospora amorphoporcata]
MWPNQTSRSVRKKSSEYDLDELSPRPDNPFLSHRASQNHSQPAFRRRTSPSPSRSSAFSDKASTTRSTSKSKKSRVLFAGPPPPIFSTQIIQREVKDRYSSTPTSPLEFGVSTIALNINSVLFDKGDPTVRNRDDVRFEQDTFWRNLQHREWLIQKEFQHILDAQATGLMANLDPDSAPPSSSNVSDAGSTSTARRSHAVFELPTRTTETGEIIPVRQPRQKTLTLRGARAALARTMALAADLKIEEEANLDSALFIRKKALSELRRLSTQRDAIVEELRTLEGDDEEPLARELRELDEEYTNVRAEIAELEERLVDLRKRKRWLDGRRLDVRNRREAGLSGYKGALREVDDKLEDVLIKPRVLPLDIEAVVGPSHNEGNQEVEQQALVGLEFMRLRPERRTADMAKDWWESEVALLERRKEEVNKERSALEEGAEVWREVVRLVMAYEEDLRKEIAKASRAEPQGFSHDSGKGKGKAVADDQATSPLKFYSSQLDKITKVMGELEEKFNLAEEHGWKLLLYAIGAELEAFKQAKEMIRGMLMEQGYEVEDEKEYQGSNGSTPRLGRSAATVLQDSTGAWSTNNRSTATEHYGVDDVGHQGSNDDNHTYGRNHLDLVDLEDEPHEHEEEKHTDHDESDDNEVPPDLLVSRIDNEDEDSQPGGGVGLRASRQGLESTKTTDSENDVPPEFLAHHGDDVE